ncbi:MAG: 50S ribosomal protein L10, partial [Candidatus Korarchaeota archaeon]|nr:50S ribosomal protein L10 [Candidatus Korarchaeota archaeon]NIU84383.1 50S ribosomal protein L10 [Candidatus Thorarchaeota archaeon]NIW12860.1 50S ribosomal protein L10 [Candidatus Thorarchaeota archaeon]
MPSVQVLEEKISEVEEITRMIKEHDVIGIASLHKVRAPQLQNFKKNLADRVTMKVVKNTLMERAIQQCNERPGIQKLINHLEGSNIFLFTDMNPFKLFLLLEGSKVKITAKAGDKAALDVTVPAGNTGQPPGPIIGQLNVVGLRTRIESGSVWINKDTMVAKKGDIISERLAVVLSKLGMKPVEARL